MWLRIAAKYKVGYVDAPLSKIYIHGGERISDNYSKKIQGLGVLNKKFADYLKLHKKEYTVRVLKIVKYYVLSGARKTARKKLAQSIKLNPLIMVEQSSLFVGSIYGIICKR